MNILFEWPQSFFPATKIYILTFNLTHFLTSLMGSFHFPQWKIFFPIHWFIVWNVTILFYVTPYLIFNRVKLQLGHKLSQFIHRFNIWILKSWFGAVYISKFFPIRKKDGKLELVKSLYCISKFSPIHWKVWKLRFLSLCFHFWSNGECGANLWLD